MGSLFASNLLASPFSKAPGLLQINLLFKLCSVQFYLYCCSSQQSLQRALYCRVKKHQMGKTTEKAHVEDLLRVAVTGEIKDTVSLFTYVCLSVDHRGKISSS